MVERLSLLKFGGLYQAEGPDPEALTEEEGVEMALESMRRACASEEVREMIELRLKAQHDEASRMEHARRKGLEQGRQEGREEGREEGLERGLQAGLVSAARRMREAEIAPEVILSVTGLRLEDMVD